MPVRLATAPRIAPHSAGRVRRHTIVSMYVVRDDVPLRNCELVAQLAEREPSLPILSRRVVELGAMDVADLG